MDAYTPIQKEFLSILEELEKEESLQSVRGFAADLERLKERMQDDVFRIAVVGEFSSGKSTFINALLGKDVLSHASKETTAVLTQVVNVPQDDPRIGKGLVRCKDGTEQEIRMDELREYTTTVSERHAVAQEIASVDIYIPLLHADRPLMLIDTPGLNGVASGHLDQTIRVVQEAHACIYLLQQRGLTKEDLAFLRTYLMPNQQNFIFVQNFIDAFNPMEGESVEQRIPQLEEMLREKIFAERDGYTFHICGVSALKELAGRDYAIMRLYEDSTEELDDATRKQLLEESNFAAFRKLMEEKFDERRLAEIQYRGTANAILWWARALLDRIAFRAEDARKVFEVSKGHRAIEHLTRLQNLLRASRDKNLAAIDGFIAGWVNEKRKAVQVALADAGEQIEREIRVQVADCHTLDEIQRKKEEIPHTVEGQFRLAQQNLLKETDISIHLLYQMIVERVEEYSGIGKIAAEIQRVGVGELPTMKEMSSGHGIVEQRQEEIAELRAQEEALDRQLAQERHVVAEARREVQHREAIADRARREQEAVQYKLRSMGSRPAERIWQEEVVVKRTGLFAATRDFLFSPKTEVRTMRDDSAGRDWDDRRWALQEQQNRQSVEYERLRREKMDKEKHLRYYQQRADESEARIRRLKEQLRRYEEQLNAEKQRDETERKHALQAYLEQCRRHLCDWVHRYLCGANDDEGEIEHLLDAWKERLEEVRKDMQREARQMYEEAETQRIAQLEAAKQEQAPELMREVQDLTRAKVLLERSITQMEEGLAL